jgi:hypothetical protein
MIQVGSGWRNNSNSFRENHKRDACSALPDALPCQGINVIYGIYKRVYAPVPRLPSTGKAWLAGSTSVRHPKFGLPNSALKCIKREDIFY